ncbi:MAG: M20/M25/M40 family metallo-hydrolase [Armatimonadetes bacterium]|nr:M20/M25/M40 family metallo-hydrolase [Armatimonadota bacterium]
MQRCRTLVFLLVLAGTLIPSCTRAEPSTLEGRLRRIVSRLGGEIGERNTVRYSALLETESYLAEELRRAGYTVDRQEFQAEGKTVANLIAELPGSTRAGEVLVLGAHYDSARGTPGANDNASGVAALLALAADLRGAAPARTVRFVFFVNEEPPYFYGPSMGSLVYARSLRAKNENVVGMISLETMGWYTEQEGSQRIPPGLGGDLPTRGNFLALITREQDSAFLAVVESAYRAATSFPVTSLAAPEEVQGIGWSDHWAFWQAGYPGVMATDTAPFRYDPYHSPKDTPDKLNYPRFAAAVQGTEEAVKTLAEAPSQK